MRRTTTSLAAALALGALLTACGGDDDGGGSAAGCTPPGPQVTVGAKDSLRFDADSYSTEPGCVEVVYRNEGAIAHTLLVKGKSGFKLSIGTEDKGTIELTEGTYELYCDVSGHEAAGMKADLTVG